MQILVLLPRQPWQLQSQPRRRAVGHLADALANRRRLVFAVIPMSRSNKRHAGSKVVAGIVPNLTTALRTRR